MEKKVYYSERNVDINELVKNLSGVERLSLAFSADAEAEIEDVRLVLDKENNIALMFSVNLCKEESVSSEKVWSLFYLPNLTLRHCKKRPEVTIADGNADIWQETEFMYAHLRGQNLRIGMIKPVAPVLSVYKADLFIRSTQFVEWHDDVSPFVNRFRVFPVCLDGRLYWGVSGFKSHEGYEITDKVSKVFLQSEGRRIYRVPSYIGKASYGGSAPAFWHFDGQALHRSRKAYISSSEAKEIFLNSGFRGTLCTQFKPLVGGDNGGFERFWKIAYEGEINYLVSAHTGKLELVNYFNLRHYVPGEPDKDDGFIFE